MIRNPVAALHGRYAGPARAPERGFTLLEILVVVLIIGIVLSLATLAFHDDVNKRLETEARRLAALLTLASQEAVLQSTEMAVVFTAEDYRFQVLEDDKWVDDAKDPVFRPRPLPEDLTLFVELEGEGEMSPLPADSDSDSDKEPAEKDDQQPRLYLLSSGEMTPFVLTLKDRNSTATYQLRGSFSGEFTFGS
jgi:general secretion pathway protein H